jgi:hypothetical protein
MKYMMIFSGCDDIEQRHEAGAERFLMAFYIALFSGIGYLIQLTLF